MKIAILGTRGIPNNYGGFEQFAEFLSVGLHHCGHEVYVYTSHDHPYQEQKWNGIHLIHKRNPEKSTGTWGQFIYDFLCILDSRRRGFDVIYQLGYTSSSVWGWLLPRRPAIVTNMDGLEWKRSKYGRKVQRFLKYAEKLAIRTSDKLIADSIGIKNYLKKEYGADSEYIPYGTEVFDGPSEDYVAPYNLKPYQYHMLIARMEPENSIEIILDGIKNSTSSFPMIVVGSYGNKFGTYLKEKFQGDPRIQFVGPLYDIRLLNHLRFFARIYFHGHTVGGTNPSLLEAMGSRALICAHENEFNGAILGSDAFYFSSDSDITRIVHSDILPDTRRTFTGNNTDKVKQLYLWPRIIDEYNRYFTSITGKRNHT